MKKILNTLLPAIMIVGLCGSVRADYDNPLQVNGAQQNGEVQWQQIEGDANDGDQVWRAGVWHRGVEQRFRIEVRQVPPVQDQPAQIMFAPEPLEHGMLNGRNNQPPLNNNELIRFANDMQADMLNNQWKTGRLNPREQPTQIQTDEIIEVLQEQLDRKNQLRQWNEADINKLRKQNELLKQQLLNQSTFNQSGLSALSDALEENEKQRGILNNKKLEHQDEGTIPMLEAQFERKKELQALDESDVKLLKDENAQLELLLAEAAKK